MNEDKTTTPPKKEEQLPTNQEDSAQDQDTANNNNSSWGSWWSSASTLVSSSVNQYIMPTVSNLQQNLVETTSQLSSKVREMTIEETNEVVPNTVGTSEKPPVSDTNDSKSDPTLSNNNITSTNSKEESTNNEFFSAVDKGFTAIENSVGVIGSYFNQGIAKVMENSSDIEQLKTTAMGLASVSLEKAKSLATYTTEKGYILGEQLASTSIDTLENVGKSAVKLLTVQESIPNKNDNKSTQQQENNAEIKVEEVLNHNYFEDFQGSVYLQLLEKLSVESTLKIQKLEKSDQLQNIHNIVSKLNLLFEKEEEETTDNKELKLLLNDKFLDTHKNYSKKFENIIEKWKTDLKELQNSGINISSSDVYQLTAFYFDKILLECVKTLSEFTALSLNEFNTILQNLQNETFNNQEIHLSILNCLHSYYWVIHELSQFFVTFTSYFNILIEDSKTYLDNTMNEELIVKKNSHLNHVQLDINNFVSVLTESKHFMFIVCKYCYYKQ